VSKDCQSCGGCGVDLWLELTTRADGVDMDSMWSTVQGHSFGEIAYRACGCAVT